MSQSQYKYIDFVLLVGLFRNVVVKDMIILVFFDLLNIDGIDLGIELSNLMVQFYLFNIDGLFLVIFGLNFL